MLKDLADRPQNHDALADLLRRERSPRTTRAHATQFSPFGDAGRVDRVHTIRTSYSSTDVCVPVSYEGSFVELPVDLPEDLASVIAETPPFENTAHWPGGRSGYPTVVMRANQASA